MMERDNMSMTNIVQRGGGRVICKQEGSKEVCDYEHFFIGIVKSM